ncbi:MAG: NAD(P)H-binding protein [Bacteroidota bacterium]|nr:NAD(P)H-binding protein [Bacteroidota bacterium]
MKTAIVIGATGLIGKWLVRYLLEDPRYSNVKVFSRRSLNINNTKLTEEIVDFEQIVKWKNKITGDEIYSALGSTIKKAGSADARNKIDFTYQYEVIKAASENGVKSCALVSSIGASSLSKNSYLKMKGELDDKIKELPFINVRIFRPSFLLGDREEKRTVDMIISPFVQMFTTLIPPFRKYKPIFASTVAKSMIRVTNNEKLSGYLIFESEKIIQ